MSVSSDIDARVDIPSQRVDVLLSTHGYVAPAPMLVIADSEIDDRVVDEPRWKRLKFVSKYPPLDSTFIADMRTLLEESYKFFLDLGLALSPIKKEDMDTFKKTDTILSGWALRDKSGNYTCMNTHFMQSLDTSKGMVYYGNETDNLYPAWWTVDLVYIPINPGAVYWVLVCVNLKGWTITLYHSVGLSYHDGFKTLKRMLDDFILTNLKKSVTMGSPMFLSMRGHYERL